jgi:hypothetical protein
MGGATSMFCQIIAQPNHFFAPIKIGATGQITDRAPFGIAQTTKNANYLCIHLDKNLTKINAIN